MYLRNAYILKPVIEFIWNNNEGRGYSQQEFAEICEISRAYYGRIERGEHSATIDKCQKIANALNVRLADLFTEMPEWPAICSLIYRRAAQTLGFGLLFLFADYFPGAKSKNVGIYKSIKLEAQLDFPGNPR